MVVKTKLLFLSLLSLVALSTGFVSSFENVNNASNSEFGVLYHGPSTLRISEIDNGYIYQGKLGRDRGGFIFKNLVNPGHLLSFDFVTRVDSGEELMHGGAQNRAYVITLNEYPFTGYEYDLNYNNHTNSSVNGFQIEIRTNYSNEIVIGALKHSNRKPNEAEEITLGKEEYPYLYSAFYNQTFNECLASEFIKVKVYPSDASKVEKNILLSTHYTVTFVAQNDSGQPLGKEASICLSKDDISTNGDFITSPHLGVFVINEPNADKIIDVKIGIKNIDNGKIESISIDPEEISGLKLGEVRKINVTAYPFPGHDLDGVTFNYISDNPLTVDVNSNGEISAVSEYGITYINVISSEGNLKKIKVSLFDDVKPEITISNSIAIPSTVRQYESIAIPNFIATDNWGKPSRRVYLSSPTYKEIPCDESYRYLHFTATEVGQNTITYEAVDSVGNVSTKFVNFDVVQSDVAADWVKYGSYYSESILSEFKENNSISFTGTVGKNGLYGSSSEAGIYYNNPLIFNKLSNNTYSDVSFKLKVNYSKGNPVINNNETEYNRFFMFNFVEASSNNTVGPDLFKWGTSGMHLLLGKRASETPDDLLWYEFRCGTDQLSRQHTTIIDPDTSLTGQELNDERERAYDQYCGGYCGGESYLPWFKEGDARKLASKFSKGEWFEVKIEYFDINTPGYDDNFFDNYYVLTLDELKFRVPADRINGKENGFERQAYIGFKEESSNGDIPFDISIKDIKNGEEKGVVFNNEQTKTYFKKGDSFSLNPSTIGYDGNIVLDSFKFESLNKNVATVDSNGFVNIVAPGITKIKVTSNKCGKAGFFDINVDVDSFALKHDSIVVEINSDAKIEFTNDFNSLPLNFSSSNSRIVAALEDGTLQAVGIGESDVTISYLNHSVICHICVVKESLDNNKNGCNGSISSLNIICFLLAIGSSSFVFIRKRKLS